MNITKATVHQCSVLKIISPVTSKLKSNFVTGFNFKKKKKSPTVFASTAPMQT